MDEGGESSEDRWSKGANGRVVRPLCGCWMGQKQGSRQEIAVCRMRIGKNR
jgi:hypothetical protein